jgi:hypothetical protein
MLVLLVLVWLLLLWVLLCAAAVDVDADGDDSQRTKQTVKAKKRMMEDRGILALTAQRADVYAKNRVTVVAVVDLAGAGAGGVAAAAVGGGDVMLYLARWMLEVMRMVVRRLWLLLLPTCSLQYLGAIQGRLHHLLDRFCKFTLGRPTATIARSIAPTISISELFTAVNNNFV